MYAQVIRRVSPDGAKIETIAGNATARTAPLGDGKPALRGPHRRGQRHDGRPRRHDLLGRALQRDQQLEGPPAQARAGRHRHHRRRRRRQGRRERQPGRRGRARQRPEGRRDRRPTARSTSRSASRRRSSRSIPPATPPASRARASRNERGKITTGGKASESYIDCAVRDRRSQRRHGLLPLAGYDVSPSSGVILKVDPSGTLLQAAGRLLGTCGNGQPDGRERDQRLHAEPLDDDRRRRRRRRDVRRRPLPDPQGRAAAAGLRGRGPRAAFLRRPRGLRVRPQRAPPAHPRRAHGRRDQDVRVRRRQAARRRRRRLRQPHEDRARRRGPRSRSSPRAASARR